MCGVCTSCFPISFQQPLQPEMKWTVRREMGIYSVDKIFVADNENACGEY